MANVSFRAGDDFVFIRRRHTQIKDESGEIVNSHSDEEVSIIRVPEDFIMVGGSIEPEYRTEGEKDELDVREVVVRLRMR